MVYFIRSPAGRIKIGTTIRLSQRLRQLAADHGEDLEVLAVVEGSFDVERALHGRFAHLRHVGEWFEPGDDLMGFIASDGRPWDGTDELPARAATSVRFTNEAIKWARISSGYTMESVTVYLSRIIAEHGRQDVGRLRAASQRENEG